jgi:hypothetical protein
MQQSLPTMLKIMKLTRVPKRVLQLTVLAMLSRSFDRLPLVHMKEYSAGRHERTQAAWQEHKSAVPFQLDIGGRFMGMLGDVGYAHAVMLALNNARDLSASTSAS